MPEIMKRLFLIDGHALIFRSYYAFLRRPMVNSKGEDTSVLFGFTKTLIDLIIKERPTHLAVAFDPPAKTFRHEMFEAYKANRSETPELIKSALNPLIELMDAISVPVVMKIGFEADDVIGTMAKKAEKEGFRVYMVTPDKDYGQLVSENIYQCKPAKNGNEMEVLGREEICNMYGIENPSQIIDILTLWGDASDNVPGVRGIGEVSSKKLIQKYKTLDKILSSLNELPDKQQEAFKEAEKFIDLSKKLITIDINVDVPWDENSLKLETPHFNELKRLFNHYEFGSLSRSIPKLEEIFTTTLTPEEQQNTEKNQEVKNNKVQAFKLVSDKEIINKATENGEIAIRTEGKSIIFSTSNLVSVCSNINLYKEILSEEKVIKCGYDLKAFINYLRDKGIILKGYLADIELMHYLIMPERAHKIEILAPAYLDIDLSSGETMVQADLFQVTESRQEDKNESLIKESLVLLPLYHKLLSELQESSLLELYNTIEMPLIYVLADMEHEGVKIDRQKLNEYSRTLTSELAEIENSIREMADEPTLNVSSPKQLGVILYEKLNLAAKAKTTSKKNYSTDEETLSELADSHPIIAKILEYRNIKKLLSTYIDPLPYLISPTTGKIHTTYNQSLTSTGRLSSVKPNLQNIPIRTERGREIRKAFIPSDPNGCIMSSDYSQIELRLMAHMSEDKDFIEAFRAGKDIHAATASKIFGIPEEQLTKEQRNRAKVANFGIIYGISSFGLSQRLHITRAESKKLIEDYFNSYPQVKEYISDMIEYAKKEGYVKTLYGRKRFLPDISSRNQVVRGLAERNAVNAPIQGSAADIIKVAMIKVANRLKNDGLKSKMVLQVHDELVFDVVPDEIDILTRVVKEEMESVIRLSVPLTVECESGSNWLEAH
ncbi:MAG: DNA polymerase I [Bacteroidetes bacterium GWF2_40_14]|nr:MAG: DNA polymerase I [Bacteroidetes bacterium GWF2_40_14]